MEIGSGLIGSCSKELQKIYKDWFNLVDSDGDGRITGNEGAKFFAMSKLSRPDLKQVWAIADSKRQGFLGFTEFVTAMQLIFFAQEHELSPDILKSEVDWENIKPPVIEGLDAFIAKTMSSTTNGIAGNGITPNQSSSQWSASKSVKKLPLNAVTSIVDGLKRLYIEMLKSLEVAYHFNDFGNPLLTHSVFDAKPMIMLLGQSSILPHLIDNDFHDRIVLCIQLLCNKGEEMKRIWLQSCRQCFVKMLEDKKHREAEETRAMAQISNALPGYLIDFYHLKVKSATGEFVKDGDDTNILNLVATLALKSELESEKSALATIGQREGMAHVAVAISCPRDDRIWLQSCRQCFVKMLEDKKHREAEETRAMAQISNALPGYLIDFYHLKVKSATGEFVKDGDDTNILNLVAALALKSELESEKSALATIGQREGMTPVAVAISCPRDDDFIYENNGGEKGGENDGDIDGLCSSDNAIGALKDIDANVDANSFDSGGVSTLFELTEQFSPVSLLKSYSLSDGTLARAAVPSGASASVYEALELRDGGSGYLGKGVLKAVENVNVIIGPVLIGKDPTEQTQIDNYMVQQLDETTNEWGWCKQKHVSFIHILSISG